MGPFVKICALVGLLLVGSSAQAGIMAYTGTDLSPVPDPSSAAAKNTAVTLLPFSGAAEASFLAQLSAYGTETFESFTTPAFTNVGLTFGAFGTGTLSSTTSDPNYGGRVRTQLYGTTNAQGRFAISGDKYFETDPGAVNIPVAGAHGDVGDFTITFTNPVTAFGFYAIDVGDFEGALQVTFNLLGGGTHVESFGNSSTPSGVVYLGVTTDDLLHPFTSVTFSDTNAGEDFVGYDNLTIGTLLPSEQSPLPEPGMLVIWGLGASAAGLIASRRK